MTEATADKYGVQRTARLTGATESQLRYWNRIGLVPSDGGGIPGKRRWYSFADLVVLRAVVSLKNSGCSIQRIRRLWQYPQAVGVAPPVADRSCECGHSTVKAADNGIPLELIPTLRNAAALGIPRTEDLDGDLKKGQAIFLECSPTRWKKHPATASGSPTKSPTGSQPNATSYNSPPPAKQGLPPCRL